jgi:hypothetical protein
LGVLTDPYADQLFKMLGDSQVSRGAEVELFSDFKTILFKLLNNIGPLPAVREPPATAHMLCSTDVLNFAKLLQVT